MSVERVASLHAVAVMGVRLRSVKVIESLSVGKSIARGALTLGVLFKAGEVVRYTG